MTEEPIYKSPPAFRRYEDYHDAEQYTKGWNDAMHFIFDSDKEKRQKMRKVRKNEKHKKVSVP